MINGTTDNFEVGFNPAIRIDGNWQIALQNATLWYAWYNISSQYSNQLFKYYNGSVWKTYTIPPGLYGVADINASIQGYMFSQGDYTGLATAPVFNVSLTPDYNTFKCLLTLLNSYEVDFTVSNLYLLLGFKSQIYTTTQEGPNNVNISNGIDKVLIHVDCVTGSYTLGQSSDVLYSFAPNSSPSSLLIVDPIKRVYLPLNQSSYLNKIRVRITDDSNNRLNLNGEQVTVTLLLKPMKR